MQDKLVLFYIPILFTIPLPAHPHNNEKYKFPISIYLYALRSCIYYFKLVNRTQNLGKSIVLCTYFIRTYLKFLRLNRFFFIGGINGKFQANRFSIFRFLLAGFYCSRMCMQAHTIFSPWFFQTRKSDEVFMLNPVVNLNFSYFSQWPCADIPNIQHFCTKTTSKNDLDAYEPHDLAGW